MRLRWRGFILWSCSYYCKLKGIYWWRVWNGRQGRGAATMELRNHEETRSSDGDGIEMKTATDIRRRRRRDRQETVTLVAFSRDHSAPNRSTINSTHPQLNETMEEGMDTNANIVRVSLFRQESNIRQKWMCFCRASNNRKWSIQSTRGRGKEGCNRVSCLLQWN